MKLSNKPHEIRRHKKPLHKKPAHNHPKSHLMWNHKRTRGWHGLQWDARSKPMRLPWVDRLIIAAFLILYGSAALGVLVACAVRIAQIFP